MKTLQIIFFVLFAGFFSVQFSFAQHLHFENKKHNFGYLQRGQIDTIYFSFINDGKLPLLITDAKFECSCTHVDFPKDSIAPGQTGRITVI